MEQIKNNSRLVDYMHSLFDLKCALVDVNFLTKCHILRKICILQEGIETPRKTLI